MLQTDTHRRTFCLVRAKLQASGLRFGGFRLANEILTSWQHSDQGETEQYELSQFKLRHVETESRQAGGQTFPKTIDLVLMAHFKPTVQLSHYPKEDYFFSVDVQSKSVMI